jgi:hypothetical protein
MKLEMTFQEAKKKLEKAGFAVTDTGGGCLAWVRPHETNPVFILREPREVEIFMIDADGGISFGHEPFVVNVRINGRSAFAAQFIHLVPAVNLAMALASADSISEE